MRKFLSTVLSVSLLLSQITPAWASGVAWEADFDGKIAWSQVTYFGTLLVGSKSSLASYNPETGETLWVREDLNKLAPFDVKEVDGYPILILGKDQGIGGTKAELEAIDMASGQTLWKTDRINAAPLGVYTVPGKSQIIFFGSVAYDKEKGNGIFAISYDALTGQQLWETLFHEKANGIPLYLADNAGGFYVRNDFSGYQDPVFEDNIAYVTFKGLTAINADTGAIAWEVPFKTGNKTFKKAYAAPIIKEEVVYATGDGIIYAIDKASGAIQWQTEKIKSGLIAQLIVADDMVIARVGGNFLNQGTKQYQPDKPFAVKSYSKTDGKELWEFKDSKGGITNLVYLPQLHSVMLADQGSLIGLDTQSTGRIEESFRIPLKFKRSIGTTDVASAGVKALTGGIGGLIKGAGKMAVGKDRVDPPISVVQTEDGDVVVRGQQHILSFNPDSKDIDWSLYYAAPGESGFGIALMAGVTAFSVLGAQVQYASGGSSVSGASSSISKSFGSMDKYLDKRFSKSQNTERQAYILTHVEDGQASGIGVMSINLNDGETSGQYVFDDKNPEYTIDQLGGRLYYFPKNRIIAYDL